MAIQLPTAKVRGVTAGTVRRTTRTAKLPDAGDVPRQEIARDPGLQVPDFAQFAGGIGDIGEGVSAIGELAQRSRSRTDAVDRARIVSTYNEVRATELRRIQTEEDLSSEDVTKAYIQGGRAAIKEALEGHAGSADSKARLAIRLDGVHSVYASQVSILGAAAQLARVETSLGESLNALTASVHNDPGMLALAFESLDATIDDMAPALTPAQETDFQTSGREILAKAAIDSFLDRGLHREARRIMEETPGLAKVMSPETQTNIQRRLAAFENAETEARIAAQIKLQGLEIILGRKATPLERARHAGVAPPEGKQTLSQKIEETEAALGRPLTEAEKSRVVDIAPQAASKPGKILQDRQMFALQFGTDSEQVRAFDEAATAPGPPTLSDVAGQRKEFTKLSSVFVDVRNSFNRITISLKNPSPAGDLSLIFNYMKMLDPASVVRESEFAQAAATGSFGERLKAAAIRVVAGKRLSDKQREDFGDTAEALMGAQLRTQLQLEQYFRSLAERVKINPDDVVIDFLGPFRSGVAGAPPASGSGAGLATGLPRPRIRYDLNAERIE